MVSMKAVSHLAALVLIVAHACAGRDVRRNAVAGSQVGGDASIRCKALLPLMDQVAKEASLETALLVGLVRTESNFRNDVESSAGAVGLTQVLRSTAKAKNCGDISDPLENLRCGARVLKAFLKHYNGDIYLGLAGYNAGHAYPDRAKRERELPLNAQYVEDVLWARARFLAKGCAF